MKIKKLIQEDQWIVFLFFGAFLYAFFFAQGMPLWDDDFTSWFWKIKDRSLFSILFDWIVPISTQPQYWGFNERPVQAIFYKICYMISGYESWSFFFFKNIIYAAMGVMVYLWGLRLVPQTKDGKIAAMAGAVFLLLAPGPLAAHIIQSDIAPLAELWFLVSTYLIWEAIEETPTNWKDWGSINESQKKEWMKRWLILSVVTYLGYKSKADLKLIPIILGIYIYCVRRHQKFLYAPVLLMLLLAVPWGPGIFSKLPPFMPGSQGSEVNWMWQPANMSRFLDFIWSSGSFDPRTFFKAPTISLAALLGPFLLIGVFAFLSSQTNGLDEVPWTAKETAQDRARIFILIWFGLILVAVSSLAAINYIFRIRYGILPMIPVSILLTWVFGFFFSKKNKLPKWAFVGGIVLFVIQSGINFCRSVNYRREMGQVMVAVDQVYEYVNQKLPNVDLALFPDFRSYDYRPDAGPAILKRDPLPSNDDLLKRHGLNSYVISWSPSLWEQLEVVEKFSGCRSSTLFDMLFPCPAGTGTHLMRLIGADPLYAQADAFRQAGKLNEAKAAAFQYLAKYPKSLAGYFEMSLIAYSLRDWTEARRDYDFLETYYPMHPSISYNSALVYGELGRYKEATAILEQLAQGQPNYAIMVNLYWNYRKGGMARQASKTLKRMVAMFPTDPATLSLMKEEAGH